MSGSESNESPPPNRLLSYSPLVGPNVAQGPARLNTKGKAPSGRHVGILAGLLKMPMNIFCEVASYLHPLDILHLARTSLNIRAVLMSKGSAHVWVNARRMLGMPECPTDISEPQYAALVFDHTCFACGAIRAMRHSYQLKVRFCGECWKENVKTNRELWEDFMQNEWNDGFSLELLPSTNDVYYVESRSLKCSFYKPEFDAVLGHYVELKKANRSHALSAYMQERQEHVQKSFEFGRHVEEWWGEYSAGLKAEKKKDREHKDEDKLERKNAVYAKLVESGYSAADFPADNPEWGRTVTKRVKLTEKYWNSNMFPKLKEMIETERAQKAQLERKERRRERDFEFAKIYLDRGVPANEPSEGPFMMPSWGVFKDDPQAQALLAEDDYNIPFTRNRYKEIEDVIAEGAVKYNIHARRDLALIHGLFPPPGGSEEEVDENVIKPFLARATTVFHLRGEMGGTYRCMSYKTLSEILHLGIVYSNPELLEPPRWRDILVPSIVPDALAGKIARELLRVIGAPVDSTWEQMDEICGKRLVCTCGKPRFPQPVCVAALIEHIRDERTWEKASEAERWNDEGLEDGLEFPVDHAVSEIRNFVKVLPEGMTFDAFMETQPPPLSGTVGNLAGVRSNVSTFAEMLGFSPPLEQRMFVCVHCEHEMLKDYLVWHMNAKHKKVAHPNDVSTWAFPPRWIEILGLGVRGNDDGYSLADYKAALVDAVLNSRGP